MYLCVMGKLTALILKWLGWKIDGQVPEGVSKAVVVVAPHTSNWDFVIGKATFDTYSVKATYLIKKELFFFPLGFWLRSIGGIPVDRKANNNFTDQAVSYFQNNETMYMLFTPEGTRSYSPNWKKGFYYIALKAEVPILIGYIDYPNKRGGFDGVFHPTGDVDADIREIKRKLYKYKGKYPEKGIREEEL